MKSLLRFTLYFTLFMMFLLSACRREPDNASQSEKRAWRTFPINSKFQAYSNKSKGAKNLLIYTGKGARAAAEFIPVSAFFIENGFDILTYSPEKTGKKGQTIEMAEKDFKEIMRFAALRQGYKNKFLMLHGSNMKFILNCLKSFPDAYQALLIIRPSDADHRDLDLLKLLSDLPRQPALLWFTSIRTPEVKRARYLASIPGKPESFMVSLSGLNRPFQPNDSLRNSMVADAEFAKLLLYLRMNVTWRNAADTFKGGCRRPGSRLFHSAQYYHASADADQDFCPLFLKLPRDQLLKAVKIKSDGCEYQLSSKYNIFCRYK